MNNWVGGSFGFGGAGLGFGISGEGSHTSILYRGSYEQTIQELTKRVEGKINIDRFIARIRSFYEKH